MSFYAKYRPQTIAELDLLQVRTSLLQILASGNFSHAYLFSGPKGTGKTSSARILAKVLNCEKNRKAIASRTKLAEPCNSCEPCQRITAGMSLTVMEMDAASNRGIDDIRTLKERIGLAPVEGLFTVYIIDEVHMLTTEAFNALLKTLEEPPSHTIFVLCTTDPHKIPETVISRCTRVQFKKATEAEMTRSLNKAVAGEKLDVEAGGIEAIAARVDGSFRDGMKILEQLALENQRITKVMVNTATGYGGDYAVDELIQALLKKEVLKGLEELQQKQTLGVDVGVYARRIVEQVREHLLTAINTGVGVAEWLQLAEQFSAAAVQVRQAVVPWLPLEIAVAEYCLNRTALQASSGPVEKRAVHVLKTIPKVVEAVKQPPTLIQEKEKTEESRKVAEEKTPAAIEPRKDAWTGTIADVLAKWQEILVAIRPLNHSLEALLRSARPAEYAEGWLTIEAFYKFHKEQLEQDRYRKMLEEAMGKVLGGSVYLKFELRKAVPPANSKDENISGKVEDEALVKAAEEIFG